MTILVLTGPTAVGKSEVALLLAERLGGEILSADSMQVYRGMDIGTAKPSAADRARVPHHLLDVVEPTEPFNAARYRVLADAALRDILARGRLPLVVGGTGLYIRALIDGLCNAPGKDPTIRQTLEDVVRAHGAPALHARLAAVDPETAARVHPHDAKRIIRGLEVFQVSGQPLSHFQQRQADAPWRERAQFVALRRPAKALRARIAARVRAMFAHGLLDEVAALLRQGCTPAHTALQAVGYKEVVACLRGERTPQQAEELVIQATARYAKRQMTWWRADPRMHWLDWGEGLTALAVAERVEAALELPGATMAGGSRVESIPQCAGSFSQ